MSGCGPGVPSLLGFVAPLIDRRLQYPVLTKTIS